jgi:hypothetical protein
MLAAGGAANAKSEDATGRHPARQPPLGVNVGRIARSRANDSWFNLSIAELLKINIPPFHHSCSHSPMS